MPRLTREQSRQRTRQRLLDAAEEVFAREGYSAASCEQIAEHAEYSKGAIYSNFENKEALFLALLSRHMDREKLAMREIAATSSSAQEIVNGLIHRFDLSEDKLGNCLLVTEFQIEAGRRREIAKPFAQLFRAQRRELAKLLNALATKANRQLPNRAEELAVIMMALAGGLALHRAADPKSVPRGLLPSSMRLLVQTFFQV